MDYNRYFTPVSRKRQPGAIREMMALAAMGPPSTISLAGGYPNSKLFPFESAEIKLKDGEKIVIDENEMAIALQYGNSAGLSELITWLRNLQEHEHKPPRMHLEPEDGGLDLAVTVGSQDALCRTIEMMVCEGDNVLVDCPTYSGVLGILRPLGCNLLSVESDQDGMKPESLANILSHWKAGDVLDQTSNIPKILYTVPNGSNPAGSSLTHERKKQIYQICQEYNILILEDDPYYYLQYDDERIPSFLSLDVDGRVVRYDSFSKILSSGLRIGFCCGPKPIIDKLLLYMQVSVMTASLLSQMTVKQILYKWQLKGFYEHIKKLGKFYGSQKDAMMKSLSKHLTGLADWNEPKAGMFIWLKLIGIKDTKDLIKKKALEKEVVMVPGCVFMPDPDAPCPYVRASFSLASPQQIDMALERLADLIKSELHSS